MIAAVNPTRWIAALVVTSAPVAWAEPRYGCDATAVSVHSPALHLGPEVEIGQHNSAAPVSGLAFSIGGAVDYRLSDRFLVGARAAWIRGGEAGVDSDGDGVDDQRTGHVSHAVITAGPRLRLFGKDAHATSYWQLDLGAGWLYSLAGGGEQGGAGEVALTFGDSIARLGLRYIQGLYAADSYRATLLGLALGFGGGPQFTYARGCGNDESETVPFAIGVHAIVSGWGFSRDLGYLAPGLAIEVPYNAMRWLDLVARWDITAYPRGERDSETHQTALAGARAATAVVGDNYLQVQTQLGWALVTGTTPREVASGPVADIGAGLALFNRREGMFARIHGRFGIGSDNRELRTLLFSLGYEMRHAPRNWYR